MVGYGAHVSSFYTAARVLVAVEDSSEQSYQIQYLAGIIINHELQLKAAATESVRRTFSFRSSFFRTVAASAFASLGVSKSTIFPNKKLKQCLCFSVVPPTLLCSALLPSNASSSHVGAAWQQHCIQIRTGSIHRISTVVDAK